MWLVPGQARASHRAARAPLDSSAADRTVLPRPSPVSVPVADNPLTRWQGAVLSLPSMKGKNKYSSAGAFGSIGLGASMNLGLRRLLPLAHPYLGVTPSGVQQRHAAGPTVSIRIERCTRLCESFRASRTAG
jgi:hypothetical protein